MGAASSQLIDVWLADRRTRLCEGRKKKTIQLTGASEARWAKRLSRASKRQHHYNREQANHAIETFGGGRGMQV